MAEAVIPAAVPMLLIERCRDPLMWYAGLAGRSSSWRGWRLAEMKTPAKAGDSWQLQALYQATMAPGIPQTDTLGAWSPHRGV